MDGSGNERELTVRGGGGGPQVSDPRSHRATAAATPGSMRTGEETAYPACVSTCAPFLSLLKGTEVLTHLNSCPPCSLASRNS